MAASLRLPFEGEQRAAIARLASTMNHIGGLDLEPRHYFAGTLYARELVIPAGSLLVSHIHRERHVCTCSQGSIIVFHTDTGTRLIEAPYTFVSEPGTQRVGLALEETVWTSYHATELTDVEAIEALIYEKQEFPPYIEGDAERLAAWAGLIEQALTAPAGGEKWLDSGLR